VLTHWESMLRSHPDRSFVDFILWGIAEGFWVGFDFTKKVKMSGGNMDSAYQNAEVVSHCIQKFLGKRYKWFFFRFELKNLHKISIFLIFISSKRQALAS